MKIIIFYASNSGSTYLTGQIIQEVLENADNEVILKHARHSVPQDLKDFEFVIFGSPSWKVEGKEGQPHEFMQEFLGKLSAGDLEGKNIAFYGCGDRSYLHFCGAVDEMEKLLADKNIEKVGESLKIDSFFFDLDKNISDIRAWAENLVSVKITSLV